uniref:Uncharacterized protein n=1 Tax=Tanacetum cinerariifolium TaxID=118510 RepID=A0A699KDH2_TANCI|nr:hypothetical protein [Tanacetum cinerariifolium]
MGGVGCGVAAPDVNMEVTMVVLLWRGRRRLGDVDDGEGDEGYVDGWMVVSPRVRMDKWRGGWWPDLVASGLAEKVWRCRKNFEGARKLRGGRFAARVDVSTFFDSYNDAYTCVLAGHHEIVFAAMSGRISFCSMVI